MISLQVENIENHRAVDVCFDLGQRTSRQRELVTLLEVEFKWSGLTGSTIRLYHGVWTR